MTPAALLATLARLHLAPPEAARLLGYNKTSVYRWIRGAATVPPCVERVLWACEKHPSLLIALLAYPEPVSMSHGGWLEMVKLGPVERERVMALPQEDVKP